MHTAQTDVLDVPWISIAVLFVTTVYMLYSVNFCTKFSVTMNLTPLYVAMQCARTK